MHECESACVCLVPGMAGIGSQMGRNLYNGITGLGDAATKSTFRTHEARILSRSSGGNELRGSRLGWNRKREFSEAKGGTAASWPKALHITPEATPASVGTSSLGSLVAMSGDWMMVAGGLDRSGDPHNQVLKVKLTSFPRLRCTCVM